MTRRGKKVLWHWHLNVDCLVVKSGVKLVRLVLALGVERVAEVGVQADAEVVVHDENLIEKWTNLFGQLLAL